MGCLLDAHPLLKKGMVCLLVFLTTTFLTGCNYYTSKRLSSQTFEKIMKENKEKYLVVHLEKDVWHLANPRIENNRLVGTLDTLDTFRRQYLLEPEALNAQFQPGHPVAPREVHFIPVDKEKAQYLEKSGGEALQECHILLSDQTAIQGEEQIGHEISIALDATAGYYMYKKSNTGWIIVGVVLGAILLGVIIAVAIALDDFSVGSCPFVYAYDGQQFTFEGELFSSALSPNLERDDYLPLPRLVSASGQYRLMLSNELMEQHFIDQATLRVIQHPRGTKVLIGQDGQPILFSSLLPPARAESDNGLDISSQIAAQDMSTFKFDEPNASFNSAILSFDKPENATQLNLWLAAKNSFWLDFVWEEYTQKFGGFYPGFQEQTAQKSPETLQAWAQNQGIPLAIYLETGPGEWRPAGYLQPSGPFSMRNMAAVIDLSQHHGSTVRVKLEAGFNFWELDHAAADFSTTASYIDYEVLPQAATGSDGMDYAVTLARPDGDYLSFPGPGHQAWVQYLAPNVPQDMQQSAFLHGKGYYHLIRDYKGLPELGDLRHVKKPGYLPELSRELYQHQL